MKMFVAQVAAWTAVDLVGINRNSARLFYHKLHEIIAHNLYEIGEEYFDGYRKGKRGCGAAGKVIVFGIVKRGGKVYAKIVQDTKTDMLMLIICRKIVPENIVYTDYYRSCIYSDLEANELLADTNCCYIVTYYPCDCCLWLQTFCPVAIQQAGTLSIITTSGAIIYDINHGCIIWFYLCCLRCLTYRERNARSLARKKVNEPLQVYRRVICSKVILLLYQCSLSFHSNFSLFRKVWYNQRSIWCDGVVHVQPRQWRSPMLHQKATREDHYCASISQNFA